MSGVWRSIQRRSACEFVFGFACVFGGLLLPGAALGRVYARSHAAIGNAFVAEHAFDSGARLFFAVPERGTDGWQTILSVSQAGHGITIPIDLRGLVFLPTAAFIALSVAAPLGDYRRNLRVLVQGLCVLEPLLLLLMALPLLSFLGGWGPIRVFELSAAAHACVNIVYRALVAPPGMTYAIPLLLFWALVSRVARPKPESLVLTTALREAPR